MLLFLLFCVNFTHMFDFVIMMPLGPKLMRAFQIGPREFSMAVGIYAFSAAITSIISSFYIDRFDRKRAMLFLYAGFIIGNLSCALAQNYLMLIAARMVAGGFGGVLGGFIFSIVGDQIPYEKRGAATGVVMSAFSVVSVVGIPIGLLFAEAFDWHAPFLFLCAISITVFVMMVKYMPSLRSHLLKKPVPFNLRELFSDANHRRAFCLTVCLILAGFVVIPFVSPYMVANVGLEEKDLPVMYFIGGFFTFMTSRWIGRLSDKYGKHRTFYTLALLSTIPILINTNLPRVPMFWVYSATTLFFILVSGRFVPAMAIITSSANPAHRGGFMSINSALQSITIGVASTIAGTIVTRDAQGLLQNYHYVGWIACTFTLISIYLAGRVKMVQ